jgi:hypothetical protein
MATDRGGTQPPLEPRRVLAALRQLLEDPQAPDQEVINIVGPPYSVTGCTVTGDIAALAGGRRVILRETGQITITGVLVPEVPEDPPSSAHWIKVTGLGGQADKLSFPAHLVIESLPARTVAAEVAQAIARRAASRPWSDTHPELARRTILPVYCVDDQSGMEVRIPITLRPGSDPVAVRDQIAAIEGISVEASCAYSAPLASLLRSWVTRHRSEDIASSLTELEKAIDRDRRRERRNH